MATTQLDINAVLPAEALTCQHCLARFEATLQAAPGVSQVALNPAHGVAMVHFNPTLTTADLLIQQARQEGRRLGQDYAHRVLPIEGMDCADCARTLERAVSGLAGVREASANFLGARLAVEYVPGETSIAAISRRVAEAGYRVSDPAAEEPSRRRRLSGDRATRLTAAGAVLVVAGLAASLAGAALPSTILYALAVLIAGVPVARKAWASLRLSHQLDINVLMIIAVLGAAALGDWLEAATVVVLFSVGESLEGYTVERARRSIRSLLSLAPSEAVLRTAQGEQRVPASAIIPGDLVIVRPGERIPADGVIAGGVSAVDQAPITGESVPVEKEQGDEVFAGTVNGAGVLEVRASRPASDSTLARIIHLVEEAQARRAPTQRLVDAFARRYTPAVVAGAVLLALAPPLLFGGDWSSWLYRALVLLVVACPCALVISTPVTIVAALATAARRGVLIKGGAHLEAAGQLRALAFDKTGTLTQGQLAVTAVTPLDGASADELLALAAAAERYSEHPLGAAIVRAAEGRGLTPSPAADVRARPGGGIEARIDGMLVRVGTRAFAGDGDQALEQRLAELEARGQTAVVVNAGGRTLGLIGLADQLRPEARPAVSALKAAGIATTVMLTGDRRPVAEAVARAAGIDAVEAELLPEQKVAAVERLLGRYGRVGMVGDGVNDAPALARASLGIAMGAAGSHAALETADVALLSDDLSRLAGVIRLSRATRRIIVENVGLALGLKLIVLVLAVAGAATLWEAVFADVGASLLVTANGMRLLRASALRNR
ncbi:MAG TPA: cation-translocating P-type ATPase [Thermomicrobiaceae bacterium]|nr:cation-translocating P-type ATPase [Thermomicrobiaceae bacterium]